MLLVSRHIYGFRSFIFTCFGINTESDLKKHFFAILFVFTMLFAGTINRYIINNKINPEFSLIQKLTHRINDEEQNKYEKLDKKNK